MQRKLKMLQIPLSTVGARRQVAWPAWGCEGEEVPLAVGLELALDDQTALPVL